jgi:hypothetical protein
MSSMSNRPAKIGALGQSAFQTLCHNDGLTVNPATDDHEGWDFLVEFPPPPSKRPADRAPKGVSAFVQVKATADGNRRGCQVKLSNALRFAKNPLPCFTVFLVFADNQPLPIRAFVKHFWERDIEQALAASRAASVSDKPLHKESFAIRFDDTEAVALDQLLERIQAAASAHGSRYAAVKQALVDEAGAAGRLFKINATFEEGVTRDQLLDAMVGDGGPLQASSVHVIEERFGVAAPVDDWSGPATLKIEPNPKPVYLVLSRPGEPDSLRLAGQASFGQMPTPSGPRRRLKVVADYVEINSDLDGEARFTLRFDGKASYSIDQICGIVRLSAWVSNGPVDLSLETELGTLVRAQCEIADLNGKPFWCLLDQVLAELIEVFPLNRWPPGLTYSVADLAEGWRTISEFSATLTQTDVILTLGSLNREIPRSAIQNVPAMQGVQYLDLGVATLFAVYVADLLTIDFADDQVELTLGKPEIRSRHVLRGGARDNWDYMRTLVSEIRKTLPPGLLHSDLPMCFDETLDLPAADIS